MTPQEAYKIFLDKVNKNDTNVNIRIPKSIFILLFNEQKNQFILDTLRDTQSLDYIDDISELLTLDYKLTPLGEFRNKVDFVLPDNFLRRATGYVIAQKAKCKDNVMVVWFIKPKNIDTYLRNADLNPSFEYQETVGIINSGRVSIYKTDFNIQEAYLNYYREPLDLDISGYTKIDGSASTDVQTDLTDDNIISVINMAVKEALRNYESTEQFQLASTRTQ